MILYMNWRTKVTHLLGDCHQIARVPSDTKWLEVQEGPAEELTDVGRRYCGWCVARVLNGIGRLPDELDGLDIDADLHPPAERADYHPAVRERPAVEVPPPVGA